MTRQHPGVRVSFNPWGVTVWASARATEDWATKPGASWPCSALRGRRVVACFDTDGLCDLSINGGRGDQDAPCDELSAMMADFLRGVLPEDHACHFVACGQFGGAS